MWGVRILFAWVFGTVLGFGVAGFWWAMVADLGVRNIAMYDVSVTHSSYLSLIHI